MNEELKKHIQAMTEALRQNDLEAAQQAFARTINVKRTEYRNELKNSVKENDAE